MEGVFIPKEFYKIKELKGIERDVLALYKYYTVKGKNKCCSLTNEQIADDLNISKRHLRDIKKHLKELGYIRTDGGIKVTYLGVKGGATAPGGEELQLHKGGTTAPQRGSYSSQKEELQLLHKKEKKEKKEEKKGMTNFDRLVEPLPEDYKTQEKIDYIKNKYEDRINSIDSIDSAIESWVINIKIELNKVFPMEYKIPMKKEEVSDTIDLL